MFDTIRNRLITIGILVALSLWAMWPEKVVNRRPGTDGVVRDDTTLQFIKLGLDLQGGIHLALEIDESRGEVPNKSDAIDRALKVIRTRIDEFGVAEPLVQREGANRIVVEVPGISDPGRAKAIVQRSAFLAFHMTDKDDAFRRALPAIDRALSAAGVSEASVGRAVADSTAAGPVAPTSSVEDILGTVRDSTARPDSAQADTLDITGGGGPLTPLLLSGGLPGNFLVADEKVAIVRAMLQRPEVARGLPRGVILRWGNESLARGARGYRPLYALIERPIMTGEYLVDAQARLDPVYNQATVQFTLSRRGGRTFERETGRHIGDYMAIVLDSLVQGQPPVIRGQIGTRGQIELGSGTLQNAQDLALVLKAGALPAPLRIVEERTVGPSLGADSIRSSMIAGAVSVVLVVLVMIGYYRFVGVLAVGALAIYVILALGGLAAIGATLTLPGMAGFVLSVGIAVDANVLVFERIREELLHGKSVRLAVDEGFTMAMSAIVDSSVSTVLTAAFLFQFGTGPVKGFAVTLILGIIASLITAIFVTRTFLLIYLQRRPGLQTLSI